MNECDVAEGPDASGLQPEGAASGALDEAPNEAPNEEGHESMPPRPKKREKRGSKSSRHSLASEEQSLEPIISGRLVLDGAGSNETLESRATRTEAQTWKKKTSKRSSSKDGSSTGSSAGSKASKGKTKAKRHSEGRGSSSSSLDSGVAQKAVIPGSIGTPSCSGGEGEGSPLRSGLGSAAEESGTADLAWSCPVCTLDNSANADVCASCDLRRSTTRPSQDASSAEVIEPGAAQRAADRGGGSSSARISAGSKDLERDSSTPFVHQAMASSTEALGPPDAIRKDDSAETGGGSASAERPRKRPSSQSKRESASNEPSGRQDSDEKGQKAAISNPMLCTPSNRTVLTQAQEDSDLQFLQGLEKDVEANAARARTAATSGCQSSAIIVPAHQADAGSGGAFSFSQNRDPQDLEANSGPSGFLQQLSGDRSNVRKPRRWHCAAAAVCVVILSLFIFICVLLANITHLGPDDQLVVVKYNGEIVKNGPKVLIVNPAWDCHIRKATTLTSMQYAVVQKLDTGQIQHEVGPALLFLKAQEELLHVQTKRLVQKHEYLRLVDGLTGEERIVVGPALVVPKPAEASPKGVERAIGLDHSSAVVVLDRSSGLRRLVTRCSRPAGVFVPEAMEEVVEIRPRIHVLPHQAIVLLSPDGVFSVLGEGARRSSDAVEVCAADFAQPEDSGGLSFFLRPLSKIVRQFWTHGPDPRAAHSWRRLTAEEEAGWDLEPGPCVMSFHGDRHCVQSPNYPLPYADEQECTIRVSAGVTSRITISRFKTAGPGDALTVNGIRYSGTNSPSGVIPKAGTISWSSDASGTEAGWNICLRSGTEYPASHYAPRGELVGHVGDLQAVEKIDLREQQLAFTYEARTSDNVLLILAGMLFWQVSDAGLLVSVTRDPKGDILRRARSGVVQAISRLTVGEFVANSSIVKESFSAQPEDDSFYAGRGLRVHSLEITGFVPRDPPVAESLRSIIRMTTDRMKRLVRQQGDNERMMLELVAQVAYEANLTELLNLTLQNRRLTAELAGGSRARKAASSFSEFLTNLQDLDTNLTSNQTMELLMDHVAHKGNQADVEHMTGGNASLYLVPDLALRLQMPQSDKP